MNDLRKAAQQALEALKVAVDHYHTYHGHPGTKFQQAIDDLDAALAQQADPTDPGHDVDVLREQVRHLERRIRELHAQQAEQEQAGCDTEADCTSQPWCRISGECQRKQAEPVEPVAHLWQQNETGRTRVVTPDQGIPADDGWRMVGPLYLVPPQQAEPAQEPYCYVYEYDGVFGLHREFYPLPYNGLKPSRTVPVYTAPPQRKPLPNHDQHCVDVPGYGLMAVRLVRAVERAHGIGEGA